MLAPRPAIDSIVKADPFVHEGQGSILTEYWHIMRRYSFTLIAIIILGVLAGVGFSSLQVKKYRAEALIEIQGLNDNFLNVKDVSPVAEWSVANVVDDVQTQIKIIQSRTVLERVITRLGIRRPEDLGPDTGRMFRWGKKRGGGFSFCDVAGSGPGYGRP